MKKGQAFVHTVDARAIGAGTEHSPLKSRWPWGTTAILLLVAMVALGGLLWFFQQRHADQWSSTMIGMTGVSALLLLGIVLAASGWKRGVNRARQSEAALAQSEQQYRMLVENQSDLMVEADMDHRLIFVSQSYCRTFGKSEDELLGTRFFPLIHPGDRDLTADSLKKALSPPYTSEHDDRAMTVDGWRWFHWAINCVLDAKGDVTSIIGVGRDITERKEAQLALADSEQRFRKLYEQSPLGYQSLDIDGNILEVNPAWLEMLDYDSDQVIGKNFCDYLTHEHKSLFAERFLKFKASGEIQGAEFQMIRRDGQRVLVAIDGKVGYDSKGNFKQTHCMLRDITDARKAEMQERELDDKIQQAQKLESLRVLAGGVAHDFNNLLTIILGNADLAIRGLDEDSTMRESLEEIRVAGKRASALSLQMLAYSGRGALNIQAMDLARHLVDRQPLLRAAAPSRITMEFRGMEDLPRVKADPSQIRQVLVNLVTNAAEAFDGGHGSISVSAGVMQADSQYLAACPHDHDIRAGEFVYFEIADDGPGMDAETLGRVFDPFFSTKFPGRGLGLAASQGIVRGHKGTIRMTSTAGKGTTVRVLLPVLEQVCEQVDAEHKPTQQIAIESDDKAETILVVDDEGSLLRIVRASFEEDGMEVLLASDGIEALQVFRKHLDRIDLVLLDLTMPRMSGVEVLDEMQKICPDVLVLLTSGFSEEEVMDRLADRNVAGFVQKPIQFHALRERVRKIIRHRADKVNQTTAT